MQVTVGRGFVAEMAPIEVEQAPSNARIVAEGRMEFRFKIVWKSCDVEEGAGGQSGGEG